MLHHLGLEHQHEDAHHCRQFGVDVDRTVGHYRALQCGAGNDLVLLAHMGQGAVVVVDLRVEEVDEAEAIVSVEAGLHVETSVEEEAGAEVVDDLLPREHVAHGHVARVAPGQEARRGASPGAGARTRTVGEEDLAVAGR